MKIKAYVLVQIIKLAVIQYMQLSRIVDPVAHVALCSLVSFILVPAEQTLYLRAPLEIEHVSFPLMVNF